MAGFENKECFKPVLNTAKDLLKQRTGTILLLCLTNPKYL
jgi:TusA-related sulfurtransferase